MLNEPGAISRSNRENSLKGRYGFLLPPEQIEPNSEEVIASFIPMAEELRKN